MALRGVVVSVQNYEGLGTDDAEHSTQVDPGAVRQASKSEVSVIARPGSAPAGHPNQDF